MVEVSVIIPLYNKENYIGRTIKSVFNQTFSNFELIVVNDCSTDNSLAVVSALQDERLHVVQHQKNKGLSASRNTGITHAKGKIITFLDADDLWKEDFLFHIHQLSLKFEDCDIYATDYYERYGTNQNLPKNNLGNFYKPNQYIKIKDFFQASLFNPVYCFSCVAFSKVAIDEIGLFNEFIDYGEDVDFNIRSNLKFQLAYYCAPCAIYHMDVSSQMTASGIKHKTLPDLKALAKLAPAQASLMQYINMKNYYYASQYKSIQDKKAFQNYLDVIDFSKISLKQTLLLKSPYWIYNLLKKGKLILLKNGIKVTPY